MCEAEIRYRVAEGFVHRQVAVNDVLISVGANVANFNGYITHCLFSLGCIDPAPDSR